MQPPHDPPGARVAARTAAARALPAFLLVFLLGSCTQAKRSADPDLRFWLENMVHHHGYGEEEVALVVDLDDPAIRAAYERTRTEARDPAARRGRPLLLPYPGGRHPRIGFLDGAVDPHRDTKASVFSPWPDGGYVVVDLPEAVWGNGRLQYLAHTHIPTVWDDRGVKLERMDWTREGDGALAARRVLPDGVEFRARAAPRDGGADFLLEIHNGSPTALRDVRAQICVLLKGAPPFAALTAENKVALGEAMAVRAASGDRWVVIAFENGKTWGNADCPCLHSDPAFGDVAAGESVARHGRLFFHDGRDVAAEVDRRRQAGTLLPSPPPAAER